MLFMLSAFAGAFSSAHAQQPIPAPDVSLLVLSCDFAQMRAQHDGIFVRNCRRYAPDVISEWHASIAIRLATDQGHFVVTTDYIKSPWWVSNWSVRIG